MPNVPEVRTVPARDRNCIRKHTYSLRKEFGLETIRYFPIMQFLENILPLVDPYFYVEPVEDRELQGRAAETIREQHLIRVKKSVYDAACSGHPWARKILAHELGHYMLHSADEVVYAYPMPGERVPKEQLPEYQAEVFASELLMPVNLICGMNPRSIAQQFGVPVSAAAGQLHFASHTNKAKRSKRKRPSKKLDR